MLDGGPADPELRRDDRHHLARRVLAAREHLDNASTNRLAHHFKRIHVFSLSVRVDITAN